MSTTLDTDLDAVVTLLRKKIKEHGFTQAAIQNELGWQGSYVSQILANKSLRVKQLLQILGVINCDPTDFFRELFKPSQHLELEAKKALFRQVRDGLQAMHTLLEGWLGERKEL